MPIQRHSRRQISHPPDLIVGSGTVTSYVWRIHLDIARNDYRFDLVRHFRPGEPDGHQLFSPDDLPHLLNWIRVLIQELLNDGGLTSDNRLKLKSCLGYLNQMPLPQDVDDDAFDREDNQEFLPATQDEV